MTETEMTRTNNYGPSPLSRPRLTPEFLEGCYRKIGKKPTAGQWISFNGDRVCGLTAAGVAHGPVEIAAGGCYRTALINETIAWVHTFFGNDYTHGFIAGFDGDEATTHTNVYLTNERLAQGYADGVVCRKHVFSEEVKRKLLAPAEPIAEPIQPIAEAATDPEVANQKT